MATITLTGLEQESNLSTYKIVVPVSDLTGTAATSLSQSLTAAPISAGDVVQDVTVKVVTPFSGGSVSALTVSAGIDYASATDNTTGLLAASSVFTGAVGWASGNRLYAIDNGSILLTWAATGANLSVLTAGQMEVYVRVRRAADVK